MCTYVLHYYPFLLYYELYSEMNRYVYFIYAYVCIDFPPLCTKSNYRSDTAVQSQKAVPFGFVEQLTTYLLVTLIICLVDHIFK